MSRSCRTKPESKLSAFKSCRRKWSEECGCSRLSLKSSSSHGNYDAPADLTGARFVVNGDLKDFSCRFDVCVGLFPSHEQRNVDL